MLRTIAKDAIMTVAAINASSSALLPGSRLDHGPDSTPAIYCGERFHPSSRCTNPVKFGNRAKRIFA
jgi:hypothetical protein